MATKIAARIEQLESTMRCATPFCGRPTMAAAGQGLAETLCKRCIQHRARHGSSWCPSIPAPSLKPYLATATKWVSAHKGVSAVAYALLGLRGLLDGAGRVEPAMDMKRRPSADKARVAFARLREAGIGPERMLATHLAVSAWIEDAGSYARNSEYRLVQTAKVLHRLASGTHRHYEWPRDDGTVAPLSIHVYPRSSGLALMVIGKEVDEVCGAVVEGARDAVRADKLARYGPHESTLPGYKAPWMVARERALRSTKERPASDTAELPAPVKANVPAATSKEDKRPTIFDWLRLPDADGR